MSRYNFKKIPAITYTIRKSLACQTLALTCCHDSDIFLKCVIRILPVGLFYFIGCNYYEMKKQSWF